MDDISDIQSQAAPEVRPYIPAARAVYSFLADAREDLRESVRKIIQTAGIIREQTARLRLAEAERQPDPKLDLSPDNVIRSAEAVKRFAPELLQLRRDIFGSDMPPFPDMEKGVEWLIEEAQRETAEFRERYALRFEEIKEKKERLYSLAQELNGLSSWRVDIAEEQRALPVIRRKFKGKRKPPFLDFIMAYPAAKLGAFADLVRSVSILGGFYESSLVAHVLTGSPPVRRAATISIQAQLNDAEISSLIKRLRLYRRRGKKLTDRHLRLYNFIEERGGLPRTNKMATWQKWAEEWSTAFPEDGLNAEAVRKSVENLYKKYLRRPFRNG
jgi:ferritin